MKISNYDKYKYDYKTYWDNREYEDSAERIALKKLFKNQSGKWFLDIGGSYGRLTDLYADRYTNPVILDYSLETLAKNRDELRGKYKNVELIAANVYKLPFRENSIDGAMMMRVLHHIESPQTYLEQLEVVLTSKSMYIQEFANSIHIKQILKSLLSLRFLELLKMDRRQINSGNYEGSDGEETVFLVFHPRFILKSLKKYGFKVSRTIGTSFLRIPFIKRILPLSILLLIEKMLQSTLSFLKITPSIIMRTSLEKDGKERVEYKKLEDILVCPDCKGELTFSKDKAKCNDCNMEYLKKDKIWDLRVD